MQPGLSFRSAAKLDAAVSAGKCLVPLWLDWERLCLVDCLEVAGATRGPETPPWEPKTPARPPFPRATCDIELGTSAAGAAGSFRRLRLTPPPTTPALVSISSLEAHTRSQQWTLTPHRSPASGACVASSCTWTKPRVENANDCQAPAGPAARQLKAAAEHAILDTSLC